MKLTFRRPVCRESFRSSESRRPPPDDGWNVARDSLGWLGFWRPAEDGPADDALAKHAEWTGPAKLACEGGRVIRRVDFFLGRRHWAAAEASLDSEAAGLGAALIDELHHLARNVFGVQGPPLNWSPPPARSVAEWLEAAGHPVAVDRDGNLRLTLTRAGCDGQIGVAIQPGLCRFTMPLGRWRNLPEMAEAAMFRLIHQANARLRLVRLAWTVRDGRRYGEAQVDLTGLPWADPCPEPKLTLWRATVEAAMAGLGRTLRWLGHELPLLAQPQHRDLAAALLAALPES